MKKFFLILLLLTSFNLQAKSSIPGKIIDKNGELTILFEKGRKVVWKSNDQILVFSDHKNLIGQSNLKDQAKKVSGSQALGHQVEEEDLGGSIPSKKAYLKNKRVVKGRKLGSHIASSDQAGPSDIKNKLQSQKSGVRFEKTEYQSGARKWKILWPGLSEEIYFDLKGNIRWIKKQRNQSSLRVSVTQWVDGSFTRKFENSRGSLNYTYDVSLGSARFGVQNSQNEVLLEVECQASCQLAEYTPSEG